MDRLEHYEKTEQNVHDGCVADNGGTELDVTSDWAATTAHVWCTHMDRMWKQYTGMEPGMFE